MTFSPLLIAISTLLLVLPAAAQKPPPAGERADILTVRKIWDKSRHSSGTDIFRWKNLWYVCFRTGDTPFGAGGQVQMLASFDTITWSPVSVISEKDVDLREPKLSVTKEDRLILFVEGVTYDRGQIATKQPRVTTSTDGRNWVPLQKYLINGEWLWRPFWHEKEERFYGASYHTHPNTPGPKPEKEWAIKLHSSLDGKVWQLAALWPTLTGLPKDCTTRLLPDGSMVALVSREGGDRLGMVGKSSAPYKDWTWQPLTVPLGSPNFIVLPDGRLIGASLGFGATPGAHVVLFELKDGKFEPLIELPSTADCGHPGLAWHEDQLIVTYHSSHEGGQAAIYFAKVRLK
jgi:hypothetical protein